MNEKSSCPVLRGRDGGNTILLLDNLRGADLFEARLNFATLEGALITTEQLSQAKVGRDSL